MTMKSKSKQSFFADVAVLAKAGPPRSRKWIDRLSPDARHQIEDVRDRYRCGEFGNASVKAIAAGVVQAATDRGWEICGIDGVRKWLQEKP
jgi:hypothetical protein